MIDASMMALSSQQLALIIDILAEYVPQAEVRVFGSRYRGTARPYSDLDMAIKLEGKMGWHALCLLQEAFCESELPFRVDVLDYWGLSPEFRNIIDQGYLVIYQGQHTGPALAIAGAGPAPDPGPDD